MYKLLILFLLALVSNLSFLEPRTERMEVEGIREQPAFLQVVSPDSSMAVSGTQLKILAQGKYSRVNTPFIMVSWSPDTYNQMRRLLSTLPELDLDFFRTHMAVAGFLGQRYTGGHGVEITRLDNKVRVIEKTPLSGSVVTQQLTNPYTVVAVPVRDQNQVLIEPDKVWRDAMKPYQITKGGYAGNIGKANRPQKLNLTGMISVLRYESIASIFFDVTSRDKHLNDTLNETLTVQVAQDGSFSTSSEGTELLRPQQNGFIIAGKFWDKNSRLSVEISPLISSALCDSGCKYFIEAYAAKRPL